MVLALQLLSDPSKCTLCNTAATPSVFGPKYVSLAGLLKAEHLLRVMYITVFFPQQLLLHFVCITSCPHVLLHAESACHAHCNKLSHELWNSSACHLTSADRLQLAEQPLHVMHIAVEMAPICKVGGLGDVVTALGRAVKEQGHDVEVILPR